MILIKFLKNISGKIDKKLMIFIQGTRPEWNRKMYALKLKDVKLTLFPLK